MEAIDPLPEISAGFIQAEELLTLLQQAEIENCRKAPGQPIVTLVDLRTEHHLPTDRPIASIKTSCPTIFCLLDDLQKDGVRNAIPKEGQVVTITETGNRDSLAIQYLSKHGYANIKRLVYGMRGWIKAGYPVETKAAVDGP